jgi:hypothetical protein
MRELYSRRNDVDLRLRPVVRDRRDRVVGVQALVERAGRIAVRHRHAALEFRHQDDLHRRVGHGDQVLARARTRWPRRARLRGLDHVLALRALGVGEFERGFDRLLLLLRSAVSGMAGAFGLSFSTCARCRTSRAHALEFGLGALRMSARVSGDIERELQLFVVQLLADAEVALRVRHQRLVEPRLLLGDGLAQAGDGGVQRLRSSRLQLAGVRHDEGRRPGSARRRSAWRRSRRGSAARARGRGWRASARRSPGSSPCARWRSSGARHRREVARHQRVDRAAGEAL